MGSGGISARMAIAGVLLSAVFFCLGLRLYEVQINRHEELYRKAKSKYTAVSRKAAERGEIFDVNGNLLVGNMPCTDIIADPQLTGDKASCRNIAGYFSKRLQVSSSTIFRRLMDKETPSGRPRRFAVISRAVDLNEAEEIKREVAELGFSGIFFRENSKRYYPKGELLSQVLGFINIDEEEEIPVCGIERAAQDNLMARDSKRRYERDRVGLPLSYGIQHEDRGRNGHNLYLTINEQIQTIVEEELEKLFIEFVPRAAYALMVDPYTGNILAMAQRPTFNPNERGRMDPGAWRNRLLTDVLEPGSTMKPFAIAGALDYGVVNPDTVFDCENGYWFYGGKRLKDAHGEGRIPVSRIIKVSSNIGTAKIALEMGKNRLYQTLRRFGFGDKTGIPLSPESRGIFRRPAQWDKLSITRFPIGQGIAATPLQLVRAYSALANGGRLVELRLIDRIEDPDNDAVVRCRTASSPKVFLRKDTHAELLEMLKEVTRQGGTATRAAIPGYDVAGKTGTSQKFIDGQYSNSRYFASFVGFVPADDPAFVLLVVADEPEKSHYGGVVAAPTFRNIADRTLRYLNIAPSQQFFAENGR